jgi:hypothetical protein
MTRRYRLQYPNAKYRLMSTRAGALDNNGHGFTFEEALDELRCEFSFLLDGYRHARIVRRGQRWLYLKDGHTVYSEIWIEPMQGNEP